MGAGDKTFKPSQNNTNELVLGHKMPHPDWTGRVEIIQPLSWEEVKASFYLEFREEDVS